MSESYKKTITGKVVSDKNPKFRVVEEQLRVIGHPLYRKLVKKTRRFHAHDETNESKLNDIVMIQESRPYSATVRWKIIKIVTPGQED
ncbi:MAG TPA: 30S ribosomal protein S17 [Caldisericia bacterium]|nr:30S ribosomal protein S17 [Caldisericia bacterium]